ncbi:MAG: RsmD family RNA methyltransferase [Rikenellaceae bacterium]
MNNDEFEFLTTESSLSLVERHIAADPLDLALKGVDSSICTQIKYLQRARAKLPHYYNARCIIPSLSYEQSSSSVAAEAKDFSGDICIDLTCGLGADSYSFSRKFNHVTSIERDATLCRVARYNFTRLGASNINVVNSSAQEFLESYNGKKVDMIYIDPVRRDQNKKVFLLEECSPDMNIIMPLAMKITERLVVKLSPMFDVDMAYRFFGAWGAVKVSSVSYERECKEVVVEVSAVQNGNYNCATIIKDETSVKSYHYKYDPIQTYTTATANHYEYLYLPNISFYKSRTINSLMHQTYNCTDYCYSSPNAPVLSNTLISNFEGDTYRIEKTTPYKPKELKRELKQLGSKAKILKKDFSEKTEQIKKELAITDGDTPTLIFTTHQNKKTVMFLELLGHDKI